MEAVLLKTIKYISYKYYYIGMHNRQGRVGQFRDSTLLIDTPKQYK